MRIVIIGSGNVASVLGRLFKKNDHEIVQVISRNAAHAEVLANELNYSFTDYSGNIDTGADLYIVAVNDGALYDLNRSFHLGNKLIMHTAGSVSKDVLKDISVNYGVLYPLQSLRKEMEDFAKTLSSKVARVTDDERLKLHVAAVIVSNFTNHLYALAEEFCKKENIDFKLLAPLIKETANRVETFSPAEVQTGPAARNDIFTLDKHLRLLANYPKLKYIYLKLTDSIMKN